MKGLINWASGGRTENGEDTGKVLLYYLQSLYYQSVSDHGAQFNEAVFLFLSPSVPISPNASPRLCFFSWRRLYLSLLFCSLALCLSALFISVHFCFVVDGSFCSLSLSRLALSLRGPISPRWTIAQRTVQQTQVRIMSLQREHCCLSPERPSKVKNCDSNNS